MYVNIQKNDNNKRIIYLIDTHLKLSLINQNRAAHGGD